MGMTGPVGLKGDPGIILPAPVGKASKYAGLVALNKSTGQLEEVPWNDILNLLLQKLGFRPGDRLVVRRCDGTTEELSLDVLNEQCADEVHST